MQIKGVNFFSPRQQFVPCGKCEECRQMLRSGWSFRLRAEIQKRCIDDGWHCGFATFTYNEEHLPHIPQELFRDYDEDAEVWKVVGNEPPVGPRLANVERVPGTDELLKSLSYVHTPCFSKEDARRLIKGIRRYLAKNFGCKDFLYFLACEYGSNTQRPHMHGLFAWPSSVPDSVFYGLLRDYWTGESNIVRDDYQSRFGHKVARPNCGFISPRQIDGYDYLDVHEKPFVVSDPLAAANYCSKYACKDLYFERSLKGLNIDRKDKRLREYLCFHVQTRSLGAHILKDLTDDEMLRLYTDGFGFIGEKQLSPIPVYIRNKLLFTPRYVIDASGRRLVRRERTEFFRKNLDEIYRKKEDYYTRVFEQAQKPEFFARRFVPPAIANSLSAYNRDLCGDLDPRIIARHYLTHYGLPYAKCYKDKPANLWAARFDEFGATIAPSAKLADPYIVGAYNDLVSIVLGALNFCITTKFTPETELADKVRDFFTSSNHQIKGVSLCSEKSKSMSLAPLALASTPIPL